jgi:hypothetical protein
MTSEDLFRMLASPAAREAFVASIRAVANDDEPPAERPCQHCGRYFDSGVFDIVNGRVVDITCAECDGLRYDAR